MSHGAVDDGDEVDAGILEAAQRLLRAHGAGFTMGQLAEEAGVSRATLYRRVPSREALAQRLRQRGVEPGAELGDPVRERILDATGAVIDAHGLRFTVEQVAEQAGVGLATVYRGFGDREGLLRSFLGERTPRAFVAMQLGDPGAPIEPTLRACVAGLLRFAVAHPGLARVALLGEGPEAEELERLRKGGRSTLSRLVAYLEAQIERGVLAPADPLVLASMLIGAAVGTSLLAARLAPRLPGGSRLVLAPGDEAAIDERARVLVATWLRGARR